MVVGDDRDRAAVKGELMRAPRATWLMTNRETAAFLVIVLLLLALLAG